MQMNSPEQLADLDLASVFARQQLAFQADPFPALPARRQKLRALRAALRHHADDIAAAIDRDFAGRSLFESKMVDVLGPVLQINHALAHLRQWMRSRRRRPELLFATNSAKVLYQPKGVVGIVSPWNYPVYLALGPLITALAAGNRAMLKLSEFTPATTEVVRSLLSECFPIEEVAVFGGDVGVAQAFTALAFDHLVFTGSPAVGPQVMRAASANLVPLTLELGGKSPALLAPDADLHAAARAVAHGKAFNAGQTCVAPDYALVPAARAAEFLQAVLTAAQQLYPATHGNRDYTAIISQRHWQRLQELLQDARTRGAVVTVASSDGVGAETDVIDRRLPLHVVSAVTDDMRIMREEIFGPLLPIQTYDTLSDALQYINQRPRPLALYPFGFDQASLSAVLKATHSGGVTVNDWGWHVFNHDLPFGGSGRSGLGTYHAEEGFRELSHAKAVFSRRPWFPLSLFYPPYGTWLQRWLLRFYLGR